MFTNAMLNVNDITSVIRDTEVHERALFSLAPGEEARSRRRTVAAAKRRPTTLISQNQQEDVNYNQTFRAPRKGTAVAAVLGSAMSERIRKEYNRDASQSRGDRRQQRDSLDVGLLLDGAQRLCSVYPIPGAQERIISLRNRNEKVMTSLDKFEALVAEQFAQLSRMNGVSSAGLDDEADEELVTSDMVPEPPDGKPVTEEDLKREEEGIAELERRKRTLEERVSGIEKDLGGLLR